MSARTMVAAVFLGAFLVGYTVAGIPGAAFAVGVALIIVAALAAIFVWSERAP